MRSILGLICCIMMLGLPFVYGFSGMSSQMPQNYSFGQIVITQIDSSQFPKVTVQALIRDPKGGLVPIQDLENLELLEDKVPVTFTTLEVKSNIEVAVVVDLGRGVTREGAVQRDVGGGNQRMTSLEEIVKVSNTFFSSMQAGDTAALISVQRGRQPQTEVLQGLTSDAGVLAEKANQLLSTEEMDREVNVIEGLETALNMLENSRSKGITVSQGILLLSAGASADFDSPRFNWVISKAQSLGIPIISILVHKYNTQYTSPKLMKLSGETNGWFLHYQGEGDLSKLFEWSDQQRTQYQFKYLSKSGSVDVRTVELRTKTTSTSQTSSRITYQVNLQPPIVTITTPENAVTISRNAKEGESLESVNPRSQTVSVKVIWQDNIPRVINKARLRVEGDVPKDYILMPYKTDNIQFTWDLTGFKELREYKAILQVDIEDELGFKASSLPITVDIKNTKENIEIPPVVCDPNTGVMTYWLCRASGWVKIINQYSGMLSLGIALVALVLVIVFRGRISGAAVQFGDAVRETVARITKPQHTEVGAYLNILRGAEDLPRKRFPIYLNTVTPIGRDKRQADLVFDENAEHSVVSRLHCEIIEEKGNFIIRDKGSTHGTYVNGHRLPELGSQALQNGDQIEIGPVERGGILLEFEVAQESQARFAEEEEEDLSDRTTQPMMEE